MSEPKDFRFGCEFYSKVALRAGAELRDALKIDEGAFRHTWPAAWQDPRPAYFYRVLDEVQKAGICIRDWSEKLGETQTESSFPDHLIRLVTQWQQDEQSFRARKLSEILVELICFSQTNQPEYYKDYLYLKDLDSSVRSLTDQHAFFGFKRRNTQHHVDWLEGIIKKAEEKSLDSTRRWYLQDPSPFQPRWKTKGLRFSSFRQRYIRVLGFAFPNELAIIGKSYLHAYRMSEDVHFTPQDTSSSFDPDDVYLGIDRVGLLCYAIIIRCQHLLGLVPEGLNKQLREMHDGNTEPARLIAGLKAEGVHIGDFVWVQGDVCQVAGMVRSIFGYVSYRVRYIERPPIPEITDDWFAAGEVRLIAPKSSAEEALYEIQVDPNIDQQTKARFRDMSQKERNDIGARAVAKLWHLKQALIRKHSIDETAVKPQPQVDK